jgi:L-malate glycosyltransferase
LSVTKRKNILFLASWYPNRVIPGNGIFIQKHAEAVALTNNVYVLHIITDPHNTKSIEITKNTQDGITAYIAYLKPTSNRVVKLFRYWKAYRLIKQKLPTIEINHVNVTYPIGLIALYEKWILGKPYIISEHWSDYQEPMCNSIGFYTKKTTQLIAKNSSFLCPVTLHLEKAMQEFGMIGSYQTIANVVDTELFTPTYSKESSHFEITHISNMGNDCKNVIGILRTISKLSYVIPKLRLNLIGSNTEQHLEEINTLGLKNIRIIGHLPHREMVNYLQQSDVFVLFSNYENLPCVILEAFACGIPVISSDVGGIHEYFPEDFGSLVPAKDEASLEKAILELYTSKPYASPKKMHTYAAEHFSPKAINRTFSKIYEQAIALNS